MINGYLEKIESELAKICKDIFNVLDKHLIPNAAGGESKVFYHKCLSSSPLYYVTVLISHVCGMVVYNISLTRTWVFLPPLIHTLLRIHSFLCTLKLSM